MLCGIYGILPQVALWGKGKLCLKGTTQALMTHRSLQTFHENRKKTVVSREDKRVAEMRVNKESFYSMPDSARFWTYDLLEGKTYAHIKTFNYKRGLYKITARNSCSGTSYFVLFRNYEYEIFDWVDEELLKKVASLLNEANTDETVKRKVYEELERYRKRQGFMY